MKEIENLKGKVIVSCQALPDEPLHSSFIMGRMALAAKDWWSKGNPRKYQGRYRGDSNTGRSSDDRNREERLR